MTRAILRRLTRVLYEIGARRRRSTGVPARVVHVTPSWFEDESHVGGGDRYPMALAEAMAELIPTTLVAFGPRRRSLRRGALRLEVMRPSEFFGDNPYDPVAWTFLPRLRDGDVVHCHQYRTVTTSLSIAAGAALGRRVFLSDYGGGGLHFADTTPLHRLVSGFLPISRFGAERWGDRFGPAHVIYGGVDPRFTADHDEPRGGEALFVGRLLPHKGVDVLVEALPEGSELGLMGRPHRPEYVDLLRELSADRRVRFVFGADDATLLTAYRRALVTVLPSVYVDRYGVRSEEPELLGLTLLESMACGTPVICTDVGGMPELVEDGVTGFVVPPNDPVALGERLEFLARNRDEATRMGQRGREVVRREFTWDAVARRCLDAYAA
jgi:glycosyltransferase involved in cell wall biosynthesis